MNKPDYDISPHYVEQILIAYNCSRVMSVKDSEILGEAIAVLRRHGDDYLKDVAVRVRNG